MTPPPESDPIEELPWNDPVLPGAEVSERIVRECTQNLECKRGPSIRARLGLSIGLSGLILAVFLLMPMHGGIGGGLSAALYGLIGWGVVQVALLFVGFGQLPTHRTNIILRAGAALTVAMGFIIVLAAGARDWVSLSTFASDHVAGATPCAATALVVGGLAAGGILFLWRRTDPFTPTLSGSFAGLAGGLVGAVAVGTVCPIHEGWHLTLSHGLIVVALGLIGCGVGRRWMTP